MTISNLSAYGGLQRDCLGIARRLVDQGHSISILTTELRGDVVNPGCDIEVIGHKIITNPGRDMALGSVLRSRRRDFDRVIGFNRMPFLDIYYSGDRSYAEVKQRFWRPLSPRYRAQMRLERACFEPASKTRLIMLTERQQREYQQIWHTPDSRFKRISPNLDETRRRPDRRRDGTRERVRAEFGVPASAALWLSIGSSVEVKGFDRVADAVRQTPDAMWLVVGIKPDSSAARRLRSQSLGLGTKRHLVDRIRFAGIRDDIPEIMAASDILVHPARIETTGTVIIEALANGLPVIATETCGFSPLVEQAGAGVVLKGEFSEARLLESLADANAPGRLDAWSAAGERFGSDPALSKGHADAAALFVGELW